MKLRIRGNSIRLRLAKNEVEQLGERGRIEDAVEFGAASAGFRFVLHTIAVQDKAQAKFEDHCLSISIPASEAENWIGSEQIGMETMQPIGDDKFLRILVEKDFSCITERTGEDDSDSFPNPFVHGKC